MIDSRSTKEKDPATQNAGMTSQDKNCISYMDLSDDDKIEDEEMTFQMENENLNTEENTENNKDKSFNEDENISEEKKKKDHNVTDAVTDTVTDATQAKSSNGLPTWVNVNEEITEEDFISSFSSSETNYVEVLDAKEQSVSETNGIEVLEAEEPVPSNESSARWKDIFKQNIPHTVLWTSILTAMEECTDFKELEKLCQELERDMPPLKPRIPSSFTSNDIIDNIAQSEIPVDSPRSLIATFTIGDGNCMSRASSQAYFNDDRFHLEIRTRLVIEGVVHKNSYLSDDCLERGATYIHGNADLPTVFTMFSEYYTPGQKLTEDSIACIYCLEIHSIAKVGTFMGLWQLAQVASVLGVPVHSIYPVRGESSVRNDFNRSFYPRDYTNCTHDEDPVVIMWTGLR